MKYPPDHAPAQDSASLDETLRLIAHAPVPEGLEQRVHTAVVHAAPRRGRILAWPVSTQAAPGFWAGNHWARAAAVAAIVFVVAGGGWGVYRRVERPVARVIVMPVAQPAVSAGFSSAGAIRRPQTVKGPVVQGGGSGQKQTRKQRSARHAASATAAAHHPAPAPASSIKGK